MKSAPHSKLLALESIATQHSPKFTNQLDDLCTILLNSVTQYKSSEKDKCADDISKLLSHRFGINIVFIESNQINTYIGVFVPSENTSIFNNLGPNIKFEDILKDKPKALGVVDTGKAVIGGAYSGLPFSIYCNLLALKRDAPSINNRELAALILHEVGHAFSFIEYSDRMSLVNIALSDIHDLTIKGVDKKKRAYILQDTIANLTGDEKPKSTNTFVLSALVIKSIMKSYKAELNKTTYTTAYEQVSDQFSARFGYGRELVSILVTLESKYTDKEVHYVQTGDSALRIMVYRATLPSIFMYLGLFVMWAGLAAEVLPAALAGLLAFALFVLVRFDNIRIVNDDIYDHLFDRVNKIRQDYIQQLKILQLTADKELINDYVKAIDEFDATVKFIKGNQKELGSDKLKKLQKVLFNHSEEFSSFEAERIIESLTSNKLFVDSARLKLLLTDEE